jgi:nicotinamide mononucleotide adenylyltransferase
MPMADTTNANEFVIDANETLCPPFDHREMNDVFVVVSKRGDGERVARTFFAADLDDARQTHQENYADESIVEVHR